MVYPSPYRVGMSSLGFLTLHRRLNADGVGAHRAFLPDGWEPAALPWPAPREPILAYESQFVTNERNRAVVDWLDAQARYLGSRIGVETAEPFSVVEPLGVRSLESLI